MIDYPNPGDDSLVASARVRLGDAVEKEPRQQYYNLRAAPKREAALTNVADDNTE